MKLLRSRRARVLLVIGVLLATGLCAALYHYHYRWKWAVKRYQRELRAAGEVLEVEKLAPKAVLPEKNGAGIFRNASAAIARRSELLERNAPAAMFMIGPGKAIVIAAEPEIRGEKATNRWEEIEKELEHCQPALQSLQQLLTRPALDFGLDYGKGFALLLPHLANLRSTVQRLGAAALCDLHRGDTEAAALKIRVALALVNGMQREPLVISQLVRLAVAEIAVGQTWALLQANGLNDKQLAMLQADWQKLDFIQSAEAAVAMERAISEEMLEHMREDPEEFGYYLSQWGGGGPAGAVSGTPTFAQMAQTAFQQSGRRVQALRWRFAWSYPDEWRMLHGTQVMLETLRRFRTGAPFHAAIEDQKVRISMLGMPPTDDSGMGRPDPGLRTLFSQAVLSSSGQALRVQRIEAARQVVVTAIALKRYQLQHGNYPNDLAALVPELVQVLPRDPVDGAPLRYHLHENAFLLYSIGEDGKDSSGDPTWERPESSSRTGSGRTGGFYWLRGRDWVWPQPASAPEVAEFYRDNQNDDPSGSLRRRYGMAPGL